ncbi:MAG TPA: VOC family protein [Nocardioidaceae bacterium]|nr:VOC family protein [Nocardioidaceae bacterium]
MIRWLTAFLDHPASVHDAAVEFWAAATGSTVSARRGAESEFATLLPKQGDAYLRVQRVAAGQAGIHLDLHVDDLTSFAWRAISLGATEVMREEGELVVLSSPGGLLFCVVGWNAEKARPTAYPGIPDQVCLDINPSAFDVEGAFWADLTRWEVRRGSRPEFVVLPRQEGLPLRLLLQRLDDERPGPVSAHLDLAGGGQVGKVVERLAGLGARALREESSWVTMRDPGGLEFCVTGRDPTTGLLS